MGAVSVRRATRCQIPDEFGPVTTMSCTSTLTLATSRSYINCCGTGVCDFYTACHSTTAAILGPVAIHYWSVARSHTYLAMALVDRVNVVPSNGPTSGASSSCVPIFVVAPTATRSFYTCANGLPSGPLVVESGNTGPLPTTSRSITSSTRTLSPITSSTGSTTESTGVTSSTAPPTTTEPIGRTLMPGEIAGIVIGIVLGLLAIVVAVVLWWLPNPWRKNTAGSVASRSRSRGRARRSSTRQGGTQSSQGQEIGLRALHPQNPVSP